MKRRLTAFLMVAVLACLTGCATYRPVALAPEAAAQLTGASIAPTARSDSDLYVYSTGDAAMGALGGAIGGAIAAGMGDQEVNDRLREAGIVYPNRQLRARLLARLSERHGLTILSDEGVALDEKGSEFAPAQSTTLASYVLDTDAAWMCSYLPLNWVRYQFQVVFTARLLERSTGRVLFAERFLWRTPKELGHPSRDEFTTDPVKGVRAQLDTALAAAEARFAEKLGL